MIDTGLVVSTGLYILVPCSHLCFKGTSGIHNGATPLRCEQQVMTSCTTCMVYIACSGKQTCIPVNPNRIWCIPFCKNTIPACIMVSYIIRSHAMVSLCRKSIMASIVISISMPVAFFEHKKIKPTVPCGLCVCVILPNSLPLIFFK